MTVDTSLEIRKILCYMDLHFDPKESRKWLALPQSYFGDWSAEDLIAEGRSDVVMRYLHSIESGFVG